MNMRELEAIKFIAARPPPVKEETKKPEEKAKRKISGGMIVTPAELVDKRWELHKDVFKPGYAQPTMTVEEYGEHEKKRMEENTKSELRARITGVESTVR
ncbi:MAG: hypothetical protein P4L67_02545 [Candidatus Pacebacteria bacterium]|nr:hypothetical protein [Candidatus Paceibacterota bacterium]